MSSSARGLAGAVGDGPADGGAVTCGATLAGACVRCGGAGGGGACCCGAGGTVSCGAVCVVVGAGAGAVRDGGGKVGAVWRDGAGAVTVGDGPDERALRPAGSSPAQLANPAASATIAKRPIIRLLLRVPTQSH